MSSPHKKEGVNVVYDIGSASVACALVEYSKDVPPKILYVTRQRVRTDKRPGQSELFQAVSEALDRATNALMNEGKKYLSRVSMFRSTSVEGVDVVFSAPWIASRTNVVKTEKEKPVLVNERFVENVIAQEKKVFQESLEKESVFESDKGRGAEEDIIGFRLNGYTTPEPYGQSARIIEVVLYLSYVQKAIAERVIDKAAQYFNVKEVGLHTFPLIAQKYIKARNPDIKSYVLVDVTGENTSITLVRSNTVYGTNVLEQGFHTIVRSISEAFNARFDVAESYLRMSFENRIEEETLGKVKEAYGPSVLEWKKKVSSALHAFNEKNILPKHIFLVSDHHGQTIFRQALEEALEESNSDGHIFHVLPIGLESITECCDFAQDTRSDVFIGIEACHFNRCALK